MLIRESLGHVGIASRSGPDPTWSHRLEIINEVLSCNCTLYRRGRASAKNHGLVEDKKDETKKRRKTKKKAKIQKKKAKIQKKKKKKKRDPRTDHPGSSLRDPACERRSRPLYNENSRVARIYYNAITILSIFAHRSVSLSALSHVTPFSQEFEYPAQVLILDGRLVIIVICSFS